MVFFFYTGKEIQSIMDKALGYKQWKMKIIMKNGAYGKTLKLRRY